MLSGMMHVSNETNEIRYIVNHSEFNLSSFWEKLIRTVSERNKKPFAIIDILTKLHDEFVVLVQDLHSLLSGTPSVDNVILIPEKEDMKIIDLTIKFPVNMTPVKKKEHNQSNE